MSSDRTIKVDKGAIKLLRTALDRLEAAGGILNADDVWFEKDQPREVKLEDCISQGTAVQSIVSTVVKMRRACDAIRQLSTALHAETVKLSTNTKPVAFHYGINTLPAEILSRIMDLACLPQSLDHLRYSSVCRRFRDVVVNDQRKWTVFSNRQRPEWVDIQLFRSGNCGFTMELSEHRAEEPLLVYAGPFPGTMCSCMRVWSLLEPHMHRCTELRLRKCTRHTCIPSSLQMPMLRTLTIDPGVFELKTAMDLSMLIIRSWYTPNLRSISADDALMALNYFDAKLESLSFTTSATDLTNPCDVLTIINEHCGDSLADLSLSFRHNVQLMLEEEEKLLFPNAKIILAKLKSFNLSVYRDPSGSNYEALQSVVRILDMPNLEELHINLELDEDNTEKYDLLIKWLSRQTCPHLNHICLSISACSEDNFDLEEQAHSAVKEWLASPAMKEAKPELIYDFRGPSPSDSEQEDEDEMYHWH